ncbi:MAG TPA: hypothetical protein VMY37_33605 [Thermoguttaceae bacterium]|nr:hypothetical protein [Thermoguttaceae bacterium]
MKVGQERPRAGIGVLIVCALLAGGIRGNVEAAELHVGAAFTSITPDEPVAVSGQFPTRIARTVENPCTATALALESREGDKVVDQAIMVSCDLVAIRGTIQDQLREKLEGKLDGFDLKKLFLNATHTHTGPVMLEGKYIIPKEGVMQPAEYVEFLLGRLSDVVVKAWESRKPGGVSWALGHAVVGHNRRAVYADGSATMYGKTNTPGFRNIEGYEDHAVEMLFFWDADRKLTAMAINVACPSQEVESRSTVNADFWHDVRVELRKRYGEELCVLGWPGAAGDQSPHLMWRKAAEERMLKLRGLTRTEEIARRIVGAVDDVFELAQGDVRTDVVMAHRVEDLQLPVQNVSEEQLAEAKAKAEQYAKKPNPSTADVRHRDWHQAVVDRYAKQDKEPFHAMELHVIRLGDVAIATNPFELFLDYGVQIKARSKAVQTFLIQLACTTGKYVPTEKAVAGGGYSAIIESNVVGPEGGQVLVERTVEGINGMWSE